MWKSDNRPDEDHPKGVLDTKLVNRTKLIKGFEWVELGLGDLDDIYGLLHRNYLRGEFGFHYTKDRLKFSLTAPGVTPSFTVGVREGSNLVGFMLSTKATYVLDDEPLPGVDVNFLCVEEKYQGKKLGSLIIKEHINQLPSHGLLYGFHTGSNKYPHLTSEFRYFHRPINVTKMFRIEFFAKDAPMKRLLARYARPTVPPLRRATPEDLPAVTALVRAEVSKYRFHRVWSDEEIAHWFLPNTWVNESCTGMINEIVFEKEAKGETFYDGQIMLVAGVDIFERFLATTQADVISYLSMMNLSSLEKWKFQPGCPLYFYVFNRRMEPLRPSDVSLLMI